MDTHSISFSDISCFYGCAKKISPKELSSVLSRLPSIDDKNVYISYEHSEDVSAYRINNNQLIVQTIDFMPPVVTDPFIYGEIAAANALSDMYAKGVKPLFALNMITFPMRVSSLDDMEKILMGGASKVAEAGIHIIGGHSIDGDEPSYGLSVTGISDIDSIITNSNSHAGDLLVITKPLGCGVILNGHKYKILQKESLDKVIDIMLTLNKIASEIMVSIGVSAATDITGFGLLGHLHEMMKSSNVSAYIKYADVPFIKDVFEVKEIDAFPVAARHNWEYVKNYLKVSINLSEPQKLLLTDPQTSGGLLISVPKDKHTALIKALEQNDVPAFTIGEVFEGIGGNIKII